MRYPARSSPGVEAPAGEAPGARPWPARYAGRGILPRMDRLPDRLPDHLRAFHPWRRMRDLPPSAPSRRLRPDGYPSGRNLRDRLRAEGLDPASAGAILGAILGRGWSPWLIGHPGPHGRPSHHFEAVVLEPRFGAAWAVAPGTTPADALGAALVASLDEPPWSATPAPTVG